MVKNANPNKPDERDINKIDPRLSEPSPEIQCNIVCQKKKEPHALVIAILALITAIAAAGFSWWQADISKDTANRQLRAYVVPAASSMIVLQKSIKIGSPIALRLFVNNMGQSPAYNVSQACIFSVGQTPKNYSTAEFKKDTHHGIAIIGKEPIPFDNVSTFSEKEIGDVVSKKYRLFYHAIVRYYDIFNKSHVLHVCSEYSVESNSFISMPDCNYED